jgi:hypothetical protein
MNKIALLATITAIGIVAAPRSAFAGTRPPEFQVVPFERGDTLNLVRSTWQKGIGCPNTSGNPTFDCLTGADTDDNLNQGLLLAKSGDPFDPSQPQPLAGATLVGLGQPVIPDLGTAILGYDIRRDVAWGQDVPSGSHCGAVKVDPNDPNHAVTSNKGSPRFEVQVGGYWYFVSCAFKPAFVEPGAINGWLRLKWPAASLLPADPAAPPVATLVGKPVTSVQIVFDANPDFSEGPSADAFGLAVLDNIFAFNRVEGDGNVKPTPPSDEDEGEGEDNDHNHCHHRHSDSHPERNKVDYYDSSSKMRMKSSTIRSATYQANCLNLVGDGVVNGKPGYTYTYQACDLSTGLTPGIGTFNIAISGPGLAYSKSSVLTSGYVYNHPHL